MAIEGRGGSSIVDKFVLAVCLIGKCDFMYREFWRWRLGIWILEMNLLFQTQFKKLCLYEVLADETLRMNYLKWIRLLQKKPSSTCGNLSVIYTRNNSFHLQSVPIMISIQTPNDYAYSFVSEGPCLGLRS